MTPLKTLEDAQPKKTPCPFDCGESFFLQRTYIKHIYWCERNPNGYRK